jgi:hypothetical protein
LRIYSPPEIEPINVASVFQKNNLKIHPMSFQAYIDSIESQTGKKPVDFEKLATEKGFIADGMLKPNVKAGEIVQWLKNDFGLGHGHAMAIFAWFKGKRD